MAWYDVVNAVGVSGALGVGAYQATRAVHDARVRDQDRRTERALTLYRDLVAEGATASAFHRLSLMLRRLGAASSGGTTWQLLNDADFGSAGALDPAEPALEAPFEDLYRVLWFFERVDTALAYGLLDEDVLFETIGFHCWWWAQLLRNVHSPKASGSLHQLGPRAARWAHDAGRLETWKSHCQTDFNGGPAIELAVPVGS